MEDARTDGGADQISTTILIARAMRAMPLSERANSAGEPYY